MLKFDDQFPLHRKVAGLSDGAFRLHVEAIFWARRNLTDGFVPSGDLSTVSARIARPDRLAPECVQRGVWHRVADGGLDVHCDECTARHNGSLAGDGWVIHGYEDWQDTRAKAARVSQAKARAGRAGGIKSGQSRRRRSTHEADGKQRASPVLAKQRTPSALNRAEKGARAAGPTLPRDAPRCPRHPAEPADNCGRCRSEAIARPEETRT